MEKDKFSKERVYYCDVIDEDTIKELNNQVEHVQINITTGNSYDTLKMVKRIIKNDVRKIMHWRNKGNIEYKTLIILEEGIRILVDGDLTTGYVGSGTSAFKLLLLHLGMEEETAEFLAQKHMTAIDKLKIEINYY